MGKEIVSFQISWGSHGVVDKDGCTTKEVSNLFVLALNGTSPTRRVSIGVVLNEYIGVVSPVYADTDKGEMNIDLNTASPDIMEKIKTVLMMFFAEKNNA